MTDSQVLADALVEAGILLPPGKHNYTDLYGIPDAHYTTPDKIITDWRVAGKVLESMDGWHWNIFADSVSAAPNDSYGLPDEDHRSHADECESLPRAVIEAWYAATEQGQA